MISKIHSSVARNTFSRRYYQCSSQIPWTVPTWPDLRAPPCKPQKAFPWQLKDTCPSTVMGDAAKFKSRLHTIPIPRAVLNHELMRIGG